MSQWGAFQSLRAERPLGHPTRKMPASTLWSGGDVAALLTNPGGAAAIPSQLFAYRSKDPSATIPASIAASKMNLLEALAPIPESEPNTQAIIRYPRVAPKFKVKIGTHEVTYTAPGDGQLCFTVTDRAEPAYRAGQLAPKAMQLSTSTQAQDPKDIDRWLSQPHKMPTVQHSYVIGLAAANHINLCREALRMMAVKNAPLGQARNDAWQALIDEIGTTASIHAVTKDITLDGVCTPDSDEKYDRRQTANPQKNRVMNIFHAGRAHMMNYMKGRKALVGSHVHLVKRRGRVPIDPRSTLIVRTHSHTDKYIDAASSTYQLDPDPYLEDEPRTHVLYPVLWYVVAVEQDGPLPAEFLRYTAYGQEFFDGEDIYLGRIYHEGERAANGKFMPSFYDDRPPTPDTLEPIFDEFELSRKLHKVEMLLMPDYD